MSRAPFLPSALPHKNVPWERGTPGCYSMHARASLYPGAEVIAHRASAPFVPSPASIRSTFTIKFRREYGLPELYIHNWTA